MEGHTSNLKLEKKINSFSVKEVTTGNTTEQYDSRAIDSRLKVRAIIIHETNVSNWQRGNIWPRYKLFIRYIVDAYNSQTCHLEKKIVSDLTKISALNQLSWKQKADWIKLKIMQFG